MKALPKLILKPSFKKKNLEKLLTLTISKLSEKKLSCAHIHLQIYRKLSLP